MILEVLEGQTKGEYFSYSIFDPSVNQCSGEPFQREVGGDSPLVSPAMERKVVSHSRTME